MNIKKMRIITFLFIINFTQFVKSANDCNPALSPLGTDQLVSAIISKLELKLESLINEKMIKLEDKLIKKLTSVINDNMVELKETVKQMNNFNQIMLKMDHLTINRMEEELELANNKYKCSNISIPRSCDYFKGCDSNIYNLMLPEISYKPFPAVCELETLDGGWTIIQRRQDGSENFYRNWTDYAEGFGDLNGEFFMGLNKIHALTSYGDPQELYIILENFEGERKYARFGEFKIDSEINGFKLTVGEYSGNAGDSLSQHNDSKFTTRDRDNDLSTKNCAKLRKAAWWYTKCSFSLVNIVSKNTQLNSMKLVFNYKYFSNLNGQYYSGEKIKSRGGTTWSSFGGLDHSLKFTQMMIRTKNK